MEEMISVDNKGNASTSSGRSEMCSWMEANFLHEIINFRSPRVYWIGINSAATQPRIWKGRTALWMRAHWIIQSRWETTERSHLFTVNNKARNLDKRFVATAAADRHLLGGRKKSFNSIARSETRKHFFLRSDNRLHILPSFVVETLVRFPIIATRRITAIAFESHTQHNFNINLSP